MKTKTTKHGYPKYKQYNGDRVRIISTGETGEAYESALGCISVWIDGEGKATGKHSRRYFKIDDVIFIKNQ